MNQPHPAPLTTSRDDVAAAPEAAVFAEIARAPIALALWRRRLDPELAAWIDAVDPEKLPHQRFVTARGEIREAVDAACAPLPASPHKSALVADVSDLVERFSDVLAGSLLRVRLEAIDGDACRRFHQDAVKARLLCTYRGPATEWGYAAPGEQPEEIFAMERGEASLWKGSEWRGAAESRLVHRSPPIAGTGVARLLLVVDLADPEDDREWAAHGRPRRLRA